MDEARDFEALVNTHKDAVYRQMLRVCGNREDAEDVLIEALFRAYRYLDKLEHPEAFRAWLASIGRRVCWRLKRRDAMLPLIQLSQMESFEIPSTSPAPDAQWDAMQMKQLLESALQSLPEGNRRVYEMRDLEDQPGEKVAEALGISPAAMKSRLHRARVLLRESIDAVLTGNGKGVEGGKRWKSQ
ncbi:MAG TPA: sigma-70 family RNA polymerase sigma factor [Bryobacteraceae bacterium]|nr:sigma-70 family RNA polymerase sigma factor [Bryobacteraceae bacterium]